MGVAKNAIFAESYMRYMIPIAIKKILIPSYLLIRLRMENIGVTII